MMNRMRLRRNSIAAKVSRLRNTFFCSCRAVDNVLDGSDMSCPKLIDSGELP
jgi:hypothetical protein